MPPLISIVSKYSRRKVKFNFVLTGDYVPLGSFLEGQGHVMSFHGTQDKLTASQWDRDLHSFSINDAQVTLGER